MNFNLKTLEALRELKSGFTKRQAQKALNIFDSFGKRQLDKTLEDLCASGELIYDNKLKKYLFAQVSKDIIKGKLTGNSRGFGFVISEDNTIPDTFVPASAMSGALHGDTVLVRLVAKGSDEGRIVKIISRGVQTVVGRFSLSREFGFVIPDDKRFSSDIFIARKGFAGAHDGDKVIAEITVYPDGKRRNPEGIIREVLGAEDDAGVDVLSIIRSFGLYEEFAPAVTNAASGLPADPSQKDMDNREDLRGDIIITIDGEDAKDLDDAISIGYKDGMFNLGVHIADVSHYVTPGSAIDKEAYERATSVYFPDRVLPMLPRELSNGVCSLTGGKDRLCLSLFMEVDKGGKVTGHRFARTVINTRHRMTYTSVTKILDGDEQEMQAYKDVVPMLKHCKSLAKILMGKRVKRGSIDFDLPEARILLDEGGEVTGIEQQPRTVSHKIIEEFMILANETTAEAVESLKLPFVYRIHEKPSEEKLNNFKEFLQGLGYKLSSRPDDDVLPKEFSDLLARIEGLPVFSIINKVMLRTMMKAKYSPENVGHFGLASTSYCHFTSPIRRYPDLMVHRIVKAMIGGETDKKSMAKIAAALFSQCLHCSDKERLAEEAEREVDDYFKAKYMAGRIGEEYPGVISGVSEFGVFVQLHNTVEGLVRLTDLPDDNYVYAKNQYALIGSARTFRLGESVKVKVQGVNMSSKKVDFSMVE